MAVRRTVLRLGAILIGLAAVGVALPTLASSEDKCCDVRVKDPTGAPTAGGESVRLAASMAAQRKGCTHVRPRITVGLTGLKPGDVRIERVSTGGSRSLSVRSAGAGVVQATDSDSPGLKLCGDDQADLA